MKKIKLFALAIMALLSTNAFAQKTQSDGDWKYNNVDPTLKTATLVGLVDSKKGTVEDLKIPATVKDEGDVEYTITAIGANAFEGDEAIKTVTFTAAVTSIGDGAFLDASNLATVTFPEGSKLATIGNGAFANTFALEVLDLSNTKVYDLSKNTPFVAGKSSNVALEEVKLPARATKIGTAFAGLRALKKLNLNETKVTDIDASAFAGDKNFTELVLPAVYKYDEDTGEQLTTPNPTKLAANALQDSYIQKLTINGKVEAKGIDALGATTLTEVTFNGDVDGNAILASAFVGNKKLATVTFKGNVAAGAINDGTFTDCATTDDGAKKLTFTIAKAKAVVFVGQAAFATKTVADDDCNVTIVAPDAAVNTSKLPYRAKFTPSATPATKVWVYGTSTYYGKFINTSGTDEVNIKRSDATVYSAYVDGSKVYMDPLQVVEGNQIIAPGECVIVKTTSPKTADGKNYIELSAVPAKMVGTNTMRYDVAKMDIVNDIHGIYGLTTPNYVLAADQKDLVCKAADDVLYVVGDLTQGLKWQTPKDNVKLYNNTLYIVAKAAAAAGRLEVIWLDGSEEEATAIKSVKTAAEKGAIYNLAGQKVSASYKGVVIKDGKKYIQK